MTLQEITFTYEQVHTLVRLAETGRSVLAHVPESDMPPGDHT